MPSFKTQMELKEDPIKMAMFELLNPKVDQLNYDDWIDEKRLNGKKKFNRINKRDRKDAINRKQLGLR